MPTLSNKNELATILKTKMAAYNKRKYLKKLAIIYLIKKRSDRRKQQQQQLAAVSKKHRRWWVRPHIVQREKQGHFHQLMQVMRDNDRECFFRYESNSEEITILNKKMMLYSGNNNPSYSYQIRS